MYVHNKNLPFYANFYDYETKIDLSVTTSKNFHGNSQLDINNNGNLIRCLSNMGVYIKTCTLNLLNNYSRGVPFHPLQTIFLSCGLGIKF